MQTETTIRYYFTPTKMTRVKEMGSNKDMGKLEPTNMVDKNQRHLKMFLKNHSETAIRENENTTYPSL